MRNVTVIYVFATLLINGNLAQNQEIQHFCVPIQPMTPNEDSQPNLPIIQGPPGQPGSVGLQGEKGDRGPDGECMCDASEDELLNEELMKMESMKTFPNLIQIERMELSV